MQECWEPAPEDISTRVLQAEADRVMSHLRAAEARLRSGPDEAKEELGLAEEALGDLSSYYLPLFEARARSHNAYRFYSLGDKGRAANELERIEGTLLTVSQSEAHQLTHELQRPLEIATDARAAILGGLEDAPELLEQLAVQLNLMLLKGELVLRGT
jgi:hypothetical protein